MDAYAKRRGPKDVSLQDATPKTNSGFMLGYIHVGNKVKDSLMSCENS